MLLADTLSPGVFPVKDCYWQIQHYLSEIVRGRYRVTSQRLLLENKVLPLRGILADTVLPGVLQAKECCQKLIQCCQKCYLQESVARIVTSQKVLPRTYKMLPGVLPAR